MLIALSLVILSWLGGGGGGLLPEDFNKTVKAEIADKDLRKSIESVGKQMEKDVAAYQKALEKMAKEALKLNADYKAKRNDFMNIADQMIADKAQLQARLLDQRFALTELMSEAQWVAVWEPKSDG